MRLPASLAAAWYGDAAPPPWARALAAPYGLLVRARIGLYRVGWLRRRTLPVPVVVVGNLSVGGTGKTPLVLALVRALRARGWRPGVASRGYGGWQRDARLLDGEVDPARYGDEPCLFHAAGVPVAVGRRRVDAARVLVAQECDIVLADDGLQHYALGRDVEICVIDGVRRFGNAELLPAGPLREPLSRLARVDVRVCNGGTPAPGEYAMRLEGGRVVALATGREGALASFRGRRVHAVAAIGNPERFFAALRAAGILVIAHPFADHHAYDASDLGFGDGLPVLMTDKDAVKCRPFARDDWWRVPVEARLPEAFFDRVAELVGARAPRRGGPPAPQ